MPRTPDRFPGRREDQEVRFEVDVNTSYPVTIGSMMYVKTVTPTESHYARDEEGVYRVRYDEDLIVTDSSSAVVVDSNGNVVQLIGP